MGKKKRGFNVRSLDECASGSKKNKQKTERKPFEDHKLPPPRDIQLAPDLKTDTQQIPE